MATSKKNWLLAGISLAVLLFGVFIFANATEKKEKSVNPKEALSSKIEDRPWFYFTSTISPTHPNYAAALQDPSNYSPTNDTQAPEDCEPGDNKVCAVRAQPNPADQDQPSPTDLAALSSEMASTNPDPDLVILKYFDEQ